MPIYEYRCESCAHELEKIQKMNDDVLVDCPQCGRPALKRLISAAAFRLKGSGWYETDFKKDNKRNLAESSGKDTPEKITSEKGTSEKGASEKGASDKGTVDTKSSGSDSNKADKSSADSKVEKPGVKPAAKPVAKETKHA